MKKINKIYFALVFAIMLLPMITMAEIKTEMFNDKDKVLESYQKYTEEYPKYMADQENYQGEVIYPIYQGNTEIKAEDYITVDYKVTHQNDLFDITFANNEIVVKVKDYDLYQAVVNKTEISEEKTPELWQKLVPYVNDNIVGLNIKIYFQDDIKDISIVPIADDLDTYQLGNRVFNVADYSNNQDSIGNYVYLDYAGILFAYNEKNNSWRSGFPVEASIGAYINSDFLIRNHKDTDEYLWEYDEAIRERDNSGYTTLKIRMEYSGTTVTNEEKNVSVSGSIANDSSLTVEKLDTNADVYKELNKRLEGKKVLGAFEVKLNGEYGGKLSVSFNVDSKYNGQKATVLHKKSNGTIETFEKVITDGKVTVEVDELSPFIIALSNVKEDSTPTLGVPSYVGLASLLVLCAGACLIKVLKKD